LVISYKLFYVKYITVVGELIHSSNANKNAFRLQAYLEDAFIHKKEQSNSSNVSLRQ